MDAAASLASPVVSRTGESRYRWILLAEVDPQMPARVLGHFTVRNELPSFFCMRRGPDERVRLEVQAHSQSDVTAQRLALRLRSIPTVIEVSWSAIADGEPFFAP